MDWTPWMLAIGGGTVASVLVITVQWLRQEWYGFVSRWPFRVELVVSAPPSFGPPRQVRIRVYNRASLVARVNTTPQDADGEVINGWRVVEPWGGHEIPNFVEVGAHSWREYWLEVPASSRERPLSQVNLFASFFTFVSGRSRIYRVDPMRHM